MKQTLIRDAMTKCPEEESECDIDGMSHDEWSLQEGQTFRLKELAGMILYAIKIKLFESFDEFESVYKFDCSFQEC